MKNHFIQASFISLLLMLLPLKGMSETMATSQTAVSIKLVLGDGVTLAGYQGQDDTTVFQRNVVALEGQPGALLPTPAVKAGAPFLSWVYAEGAILVQVTQFPLTSGAVYFPYFSEGSLATLQQNQQTVTLYLDTTFWSEASPVFYAYTFGVETAGAWPGTPLTFTGNNLYSITLPSGFTKIIFSRYSALVTNDGALWNQTEDLTFHPTLNAFIINSWTQSRTGYWSVYPS